MQDKNRYHASMINFNNLYTSKKHSFASSVTLSKIIIQMFSLHANLYLNVIMTPFLKKLDSTTMSIFITYFGV